MRIIIWREGLWLYLIDRMDSCFIGSLSSQGNAPTILNILKHGGSLFSISPSALSILITCSIIKKHNGPVQFSPPENLNFFTTRPLLSGKWTVFQWDSPLVILFYLIHLFHLFQLCHQPGPGLRWWRICPFSVLFTQISGWLRRWRRLVLKCDDKGNNFWTDHGLCCQLARANSNEERER